jgi:pyruvate carboxylase
VASNLPFLENVINHPLFLSGQCTTRFIDETPELFKFRKRRDRANRLLRFLGDIRVNGNPEMKGRALPALPMAPPVKPPCDLTRDPAPGSRDRLQALGANRSSPPGCGLNSACSSPTPPCATPISRSSPPACAPMT